MSALCGFVGPGDPAWIQAMLDAVPARGDRVDVAQPPGVSLGYRHHAGHTGTAPRIHHAPDGALTVCAGTLAPMVDDPAAELDRRLRTGDLEDLDGAFAAARWDGTTLTVLRDPFGVRPLFFTRHGNTLLFASTLTQLLAVPVVPADVSLGAVHAYLTFSFVPGKETMLQGIRRLLPGRRMTVRDGVETFDSWFTLHESLDPALADQGEAVRQVRRVAKAGVRRRLAGEAEVGLFLSGGLDSSAVAYWLKHVGQPFRAFSLDFGPASVEREHAEAVAAALGVPHEWVPADGARVGDLLDPLVRALELPFGDAVTGPQLLLARAARDRGITTVFNGEGGDQLFGGWTSKPMVAAAVYGDEDDDLDTEDTYLRSYHRFYGLEDQLYTPAFAAALGGTVRRRALLSPFLGDASTSAFLNRVRLADLSLKGSQNILPRAEHLTAACGLDMRVPLFDRALAELSFRLPTSLKLHGAAEKFVLKLALQDRLPDEVVWRRKFGMSVPITDWIFGPGGGSGRGPLYPHVVDALGPDAVRRRGWFRPEFVTRLLAGEDAAGEVRRRRVGEKLWTLWMLELWARVFLDRRPA